MVTKLDLGTGSWRVILKKKKMIPRQVILLTKNRDGLALLLLLFDSTP